MISRRRFPAFLLATLLQPYFPAPQPADDALLDMPEDEYRAMTAVTVGGVVMGLKNVNKRVGRLEYMVPGIDLYENEMGDA